MPGEIEPALTFYTAVNLLGAVQGVLLAAALWMTSGPVQASNRWLAGLVAVIALIVAEVFLCESGLILRAPHLVDATEPLVLAVGPLFFLYLRTLLKGSEEKQRSLWHLVPAGLYALYLIPFFVAPEAVKIEAFLSAYHPEQAAVFDSPGEPAFFEVIPLRGYFDLLVAVSVVGYATAALVTVGHAWWTPQTGRQRAHGAALAVVCASFLVPAVTYVGAQAAGLGDAKEPLVAAVSALGLYVLGYLVLLRPAFVREGVLVEAPPEKYARSALTGGQVDDLKATLVDALEAGERFRNPDLKLADFARSCGLSRHQVSQVVNTHFGGFSGFVNARRITAAQALLRTDEGRALTLEEIGYRSGFNSRTAFYNAFKKHTGMTPSVYRDEEP
ncbi:MAG: helix-turn-helix transcriptional regulator [Bacteroidota bacterium]